jgi:hypothetical protein
MLNHTLITFYNSAVDTTSLNNQISKPDVINLPYVFGLGSIYGSQTRRNETFLFLGVAADQGRSQRESKNCVFVSQPLVLTGLKCVWNAKLPRQMRKVNFKCDSNQQMQL